MLKWKVKSTQFVSQLQNITRSFSDRVSVKIVTPDSLRWWYWLEFGTRGPYAIDPHKPPMALRWFDGQGNPVVREHVEHPGIRPRAFVRKALPDIRDRERQILHDTLTQYGWNFSAIREAITGEVAEHAMQLVIDSLASETKNDARTDPGAKLPGQTAAEAFRQLATIETEVV